MVPAGGCPGRPRSSRGAPDADRASPRSRLPPARRRVNERVDVRLDPGELEDLGDHPVVLAGRDDDRVVAVVIAEREDDRHELDPLGSRRPRAPRAWAAHRPSTATLSNARDGSGRLGSSSTDVPRRSATTRPGRTSPCRETTRPDASRNTTSIANRIPNVCTLRQRGISRPGPARSRSSRARPSTRASGRRATGTRRPAAVAHGRPRRRLGGGLGSARIPRQPARRPRRPGVRCKPPFRVARRTAPRERTHRIGAAVKGRVRAPR